MKIADCQVSFPNCQTPTFCGDPAAVNRCVVRWKPHSLEHSLLSFFSSYQSHKDWLWRWRNTELSELVVVTQTESDGAAAGVPGAHLAVKYKLLGLEKVTVL